MVKFLHKDILKNIVKLSPKDKIQQFIYSSYNGIKYPEQADHISNLGDILNLESWKKLRIKMQNDELGSKILSTQPRINDNFNLENLKDLDTNTLGNKYYNFMKTNNFSSKDRPLVKFIDNYELAYINQRYKEIHDFIHILLNYEEINIKNEIKVKYFEMNHFGFPSGLFGSLSSIFLLNKEENLEFISEMGEIYRKSQDCKLLFNYDFENNFDKDFDNVLADLNLK